MTELTYRLSVSPGLEPFLPELTYACAFLDRVHVLRRIDDADLVLHYGEDGAPEGAVVVPNAVFPHAVSLREDGIHPVPGRLRALEQGDSAVPLLPNGAARNGNRLPYDALGLIFLMLSRLEERGAPGGDRYGRFPHTESLAFRTGRMRDPLADEAALDVAVALTGDEGPANRTAFSVALTHDVDKLMGYRRHREVVRNTLGDVVKRRQPAAAAERVRRAYFSGNPWSSIRTLMSLSESIRQTSHFYFLGPTDAPNDPPYGITSPALVRRVADEIVARGHIVGFHPGSTTATDGAEWRRQKQGLEEIIGRSVNIGRQHTLRYQADITPDIWNDNDMELDQTLSFPDVTGFRSGTCRRHAAYSLRKRQTLNLDHQSTALMEFAMFDGRYNELGIDQALHETDEVLDACRRYGGSACILYHTNNWHPPMCDYYEAFISKVSAIVG